MHICVISPIALKDKTRWGGIHTHTKMLTNLLVRGGYKVTLIAFDYQDNLYEEIINGVRGVFLPANVRRKEEQSWFKNIYKVLDKIHKEDPLGCIFSEGYSAGYSVYSLKKSPILKNLPIITFVHNFHLIHFYNNWKEIESIRALGSYLFRTIPKLFFRMFRYEIPFTRNCHKVISVSNLNANYLHKIYRIPKYKIKVMHNWVDVDKFMPNVSFRRDYRHKFSISDNTLVFLVVGAIYKPKGVRIAIKAFNKFVRYNPNAMLMIAGKGRDEEYLRKFIVNNKYIKNKAQLLGQCSHSELPYLYNSADIFLMPTLCSEGHAYTLIEAMSCGLPCIATKLGGNIETIEDAGILVPVNNVNSLTEAMIELTRNPQKRKELSRKTRERVLQYFTVETAAKEIFSLLAEFSSER